jgi:ParB family transcriptional regulator, chromosome partitioning protein
MNKPDHQRKALGKGITALLSNRTHPLPAELGPPQPERGESALSISVESIDPNPLQPRRVFEAERLAELAQSIQMNGIIQPLVVRRFGERYQLVAGERRWRAAKLAGLNQVPVVIRDIPDDRLLEITLIENIQREDLNPIETATALSRMAEELSLTPDEVGRRTGKDRTTITNFTRLLQLPTDLQQFVADRKLSAGHARCLLALPNHELQRQAAQKAVQHQWSVRETERVTQKMIEGRQPKKPEDVELDPNVKAAIQEMQRVLGTRVRIVEGARRKGKIEIEYYSQEDLDRIYAVIVGEP